MILGGRHTSEMWSWWKRLMSSPTYKKQCRLCPGAALNLSYRRLIYHCKLVILLLDFEKTSSKIYCGSCYMRYWSISFFSKEMDLQCRHTKRILKDHHSGKKSAREAINSPLTSSMCPSHCPLKLINRVMKASGSHCCGTCEINHPHLGPK